MAERYRFGVIHLESGYYVAFDSTRHVKRYSRKRAVERLFREAGVADGAPKTMITHQGRLKASEAALTIADFQLKGGGVL